MKKILLYFSITLLLISTHLNAQQWEPLGPDDFSLLSLSGSSYTTAFDSNGVPFVAFSDNGNLKKATVKKWNGSNWEIVGNVAVSAGESRFISIALTVKTCFILPIQMFFNSIKLINEVFIIKFL